jgi:hypothetical protein
MTIMKIVSHRGNLNGRIVQQENQPSYIQAAIDADFDVEVDVWYEDGMFYLGHDSADYPITSSWIVKHKNSLWCHAKNSNALTKMLSNNIHCFWHQSYKYTITSRGIPWCYPKNWILNGITVIDESNVCIDDIPRDINIFGVCVDNPINWK